MDPMDHTRGMILKARGCRDFSGTISATVVRIIPTVPLLAPARDLAMIAQAKDFENPNKIHAVMVQPNPTSMTGFRPKWSDARPHGMPVRHWLNENTAEVMPAWLDKQIPVTFALTP